MCCQGPVAWHVRYRQLPYAGLTMWSECMLLIAGHLKSSCFERHPDSGRPYRHDHNTSMDLQHLRAPRLSWHTYV